MSAAKQPTSGRQGAGGRTQLRRLTVGVRIGALCVGVSLSALVAGCDGGMGSPATRGPEVERRLARPPDPEPLTNQARRRDRESDARGELVPTSGNTGFVIEDPPPAEAPDEVEAPRDLAGELTALVLAGAPRCLNDRSDVPATLQLSVRAVVTSSGIVNRASASAPGLPAGVTECFDTFLRAARFSAPVEDGPRTVVASVSLARPAPPEPPVPSADSAPEPPPLPPVYRGQEAMPDLVLPGPVPTAPTPPMGRGDELSPDVVLPGLVEPIGAVP